MLKLNIKTRGKVLKLLDNKTIRTPRILYIKEEERKYIEGILRNLCIYDYEISEIRDEDIPIQQQEQVPRMWKIKNDSVEIAIGGKIHSKLGQ